MSQAKELPEVYSPPDIGDDDHSIKDALLGALALVSVIGIGSGYLVGKFMVNTYAASEDREKTGETLPDNVIANFTKELFPEEVTKPTNKLVADPIPAVPAAPSLTMPTTSSDTVADGGSSKESATTQMPAPGYKKYRRRMVPGTNEPLEVPEPHLPRVRANKAKPINPELFSLGLRSARWALLWGTVLACTGFAAGTYATCWYMDVWTIRDFSRRMNRIIPEKIEENKTLVANATYASSAMRALFKDTYLQKVMAKIPKDPDNITEEEFASAIDRFLNMYIDVREFMPFLRWFEREKPVDMGGEIVAVIEGGAVGETVNTKFSAKDPVAEALASANIPIVPPLEAPVGVRAPVSWGRWMWNGVWYPYYWATGTLEK